MHAGRERPSGARPPKAPSFDPGRDLQSTDQVIELQRLAGNQAVTRLLSTSAFVAGEDHPFEHSAGEAERGDHSRRGTVADRRASELASTAGARLSDGEMHAAGVSPERASGVRLHRGREADAMNDALGSEAFTHGSDIFLSDNFYSPGTESGNALLAHEVDHAVGPAASTGGIFMKRKKVHLDFLRFKRKETQIARMLTAMALRKVGAERAAEWVDTDKQGQDIDHYGHWWVEVGSLNQGSGSWTPAESYGWWPEHGVGIAETLKIKRVEGVLNGGEAKDPHHGESADTEFHPVMEVDDKEPYESVRDKVVSGVRSFAKGFKGSWNWRLAWGKNCHTFQDRMKKALGVHHQKSKEWLRGEGIAAPKPKIGYAKIHEMLDGMGILGGGYGMLNSAIEHFKGKFDADDVSLMSAEQKRQLVEEINKNQDGWNKVRASDLNDFFQNATGVPIEFFTKADTGEAETESKTGPSDTGSPGSGEQVKPQGNTLGTPSSTETTSEQRPDSQVDVGRLLSFKGEIVNLKTNLVAGKTVFDKGEQLYVKEISSENKVHVERSMDVQGGGRFWVDGAAFLAAIVEQRGPSGSTQPQTETSTEND